MGRVRKLVKPTDVEVAGGVPRSPVLCPYALATTRTTARLLGEGARNVIVYGNWIIVSGTWGWRDGVWSRERRTSRLPVRVRRRIKAFDNETLPRDAPWPGFYMTFELPDSQGGEL